jgi:DNA-binding transcriptional MerR regulator
MDHGVRISKAASALGVSPQYLRLLEWESRIPAARRDISGRFYTSSDIALLKSMGVGQRPRKLKRVDEVLGALQ